MRARYISPTVRLVADAVRGRNSDIETAELDERTLDMLFKSAVWTRFDTTTDIREIGYFLIGYGLRYPAEAARVAIREAQALIRVQLGEPELWPYIDRAKGEEAFPVVLVWLLRDLGITEEADFLTLSRRYLRTWVATRLGRSR